MLEIRYNKTTKEITGWCGDETQFGNLDRGRSEEAVIILNIPIPSLSCEAYLLVNPDTVPKLVDNPNYVEPPPLGDLTAEIDELKAEIEKLKGGQLKW